MVGSRIGPRLRERYELVALDKTASGAGDLSIHAADLTDYDQVRDVVDNVDAVVHLAIASERELRHLEEHAYAAEEISVNVLGTRNVFEASAAAGVRRVVFLSSLTVYFNQPIPPCVTPETLLQPRSHYSVTKLYGEQLAWLYATQEKFSSVCWRLGQPYPVDHFQRKHLEDPSMRSCAVSTEDIARGIGAGLEASLPEDGRGSLHTGLRATPGHAIANLVSASDAGPEFSFDLTSGNALGYFPGDRFTAGGPIPIGPEPAA